MTKTYRLNPPLSRFCLIACLATALAASACGKTPADPGGEGAGGEAQPVAAEAEPAGPAVAAAPAEAAKPATPVEPVEIVLWHAYRDAERTAIDQLIDAWNEKNPAIQVKALGIPFDALVDKAQVAMPHGNGPDLLIFAHDKVGTWARDGLIQPLGKFASKERLDRFLPQTVKPLVFERAIYGLPLAFKSLVLFYNTALVERAPATLDELVTAGKAFMAKANSGDEEGAFGLAYDAADLYYHAAFLHGFGGLVWDEEAKALAIDSPAAIVAATTVRGLHKEHGIVPKGLSGFVVTAMFNDAKVPFVFNGPWFIAEIDKAVKWAVAPMPTLANGKPMKPFLGSEAILLSAFTKKNAQALEFVDYLTSDEAALTRFKVGRQMVANKKVYENSRLASDPVVKVFRAQADNAVPMSNAVEAGVAWQPYSNALRKTVFGDSEPAAAMHEAAAQARDALAKLRK